MRSFVKIKSSRNAEITLSFTNIGKSWPSRIYIVTNMSFNAIRENKILAKISGFTVIGTSLNKEDNHAMLSIVCACVDIKDPPVRYGTSLLKNGFCVNKRYALLKTLT